MEALFPLVLLGIALHGICFDFFFAAGFIHVDKKAPADIRGSGQALFTFLTYGLGMWIGNMVSGFLKEFFTSSKDVVDWTGFWTVPAIGVLLSFLIFIVFFRDKSGSSVAGSEPRLGQAWPPVEGQAAEAIMHKPDNVTR
jgi:hypothetical protein